LTLDDEGPTTLQTSVTTRSTTVSLSHPKDLNLQQHRCENTKSFTAGRAVVTLPDNEIYSMSLRVMFRTVHFPLFVQRPVFKNQNKSFETMISSLGKQGGGTPTHLIPINITIPIPQ